MNIMPENSSSKKFYALVDIEKDEELLTDYKGRSVLFCRVLKCV